MANRQQLQPVAPTQSPAPEAAEIASAPKRHGRLHPVLIALAMMLVGIGLTHIVPAGKFQRDGRHVVPGTYTVIPKVNGLPALFAPTVPHESETPARAGGVVALFASVPAGFADQANLIFMLMFAGGTFGVLRATGAIDAAIDGLLHYTSGNTYLLATGLMVLLACGSTFLGFISEYLAIIPMVLALSNRLRLPNLFVPAVVVLASMIGYVASVTNPNALAVAQPLAGVPIFSGILPRLAIFGIMFGLGLGYVLLYLRRQPKIDHVPEAIALSRRQIGVLVAIVLGGAALVASTSLWSWRHAEQGAAFIAISLVLAWVGGLRPGPAADAFLDGMKSMMLSGVMIGLGGAMGFILEASQIQDSVVHHLAGLIEGHSRGVVAAGLMIAESLFGVLIHSVSAKAAISMPILAPIAHISGVSGQLTVTALLLGSGLINMISPTNGLLLAFLAASGVSYAEWVRFVAPLLAVLVVVGFVALQIMVILGV